MARVTSTSCQLEGRVGAATEAASAAASAGPGCSDMVQPNGTDISGTKQNERGWRRASGMVLRAHILPCSVR